MNSAGLTKCAGILASLAICSACGGASGHAQGDLAAAPASAALNSVYIGRMLWVNGRLVTAARPPDLSSPPRYATTRPDARAKELEYVFDSNGATIFDYPKSEQPIGSVSGIGGQGCTNVLYGYGKKFFWDVVSDTQIREYKVLKKPVKTLSESAGAPSSCAMDASGDLAVGIVAGTGAGDIVLFKNASGSGTVLRTPLAREFSDGYDGHGNLFADGFNSIYSFALVELPKRGGKFRTITTSNTVQFPGSVQWDGRYLTVFDQLANAMYQYTISRTMATLQGTVSFTGSSDCAQTWIVKGLVYCADAGNSDVEVFKYPAGGSPIAVLRVSSYFPLGVTAVER